MELGRGSVRRSRRVWLVVVVWIFVSFREGRGGGGEREGRCEYKWSIRIGRRKRIREKVYIE